MDVLDDSMNACTDGPILPGMRLAIIEMKNTGLLVEGGRLYVVVRSEDLDRAVRVLHTAFELDADQVEAVVYGGTGR